MDVIEYTKGLREKRMNLFAESKAVYDTAIDAMRALDAEERQKVERIDAAIAELEAQIADADTQEKLARESATARDAFDRQYGSSGSEQQKRSEMEELRAWAQGRERRTVDDPRYPDSIGKNAISVDLRAAAREKELIRKGYQGEELRALLWDTGSSGSLVPTTLARELYSYLEAGITAFRMPTRKITTDSGEPMQFPRLAAHGIATQVIAQGTAIGGTDPTFARMQLDAFKYGQLVQIANEVLQDSGIDMASFLGEDIGYAIARIIDADLVVGTGTGEPQGMMTAAVVGAAGTVATGGSLITPTYENLVDLVYSVNDQYRQNAVWLMRDATAGNLRKLRDGAGGTVGAPLWQPSLMAGIQNGEPDRLLGYPVYTDPNVAALGSAAKTIAFGDFSKYYIREVGNVVIERSDEFAFNVDEATFRGKWRVDGDYIDLTAVNVLRQSVS